MKKRVFTALLALGMVLQLTACSLIHVKKVAVMMRFMRMDIVNIIITYMLEKIS